MQATTNAGERIRKASRELAKALAKIGETDQLMKQHLEELITQGMQDFRVAAQQADEILATLK